MTTLLQQLAYQYESALAADKSLVDSGLDSAGLRQLQHQHQHHQQQLQHQQQQQQREAELHLLAGREHQQQQQAHSQHNVKLQLGQHEREQHLHQLQSISSLLQLDMATSPSATTGLHGGARAQSSSHELPSPTASQAPSGGIDDLSISDLFGLGLPRGSLVNGGQKEQGVPNYDTSSFRNYHQQQDTLSNYYSSSSNADVPSSPISVHAPASPSTPGSMYSNTYSSYSSANSSPYTPTSSHGHNKQYSRSPVRSPCYGRPIRGSPPYSDCSSPSAEYPSHSFGCNGSRSDSPADSDNSGGSVDGSLSDIMSYLTLNSNQHRCYPPNSSALLEAEKYLQNGRASLEFQKLKKYLQGSHHNNHHHHQHQQQHSQAPMHHVHHYHGHTHPRNHHYPAPVFNLEKPCCLGSPRNSIPPTHLSLDKAVRYHRNAAATSDATYTWSGTLPQRTQKPIGYSPKVFFGGIPWDITEATLISTFKQFGQIKIEWPGKDQASSQPKGYVYIIFESEKQVKSLLACCTHDFSNGGSYYYKISSKRMKGKEVQVIPWALNDSNYVKSSSQKLDPEKTVFVGALHGMMTAAGLAKIMNDLFDNVIYAGIDTDKHKYPIGASRVTFSSKQSYNKAVNAAFIEVKTAKFTKKIQVDPYLEEAPCSSCYVQQGPYFCREPSCFKYFCHTCWQWMHNNDNMNWHKPMSRGLKNNQVIGLTPGIGSVRSSNLM